MLILIKRCLKKFNFKIIIFIIKFYYWVHLINNICTKFHTVILKLLRHYNNIAYKHIIFIIVLNNT